MAYNLGTLRQTVKDRLTDQNFSSILIDQFINDEQREIFNYYDLPFNRASETQTLTAGASQFALPTGHQKTKVLSITAPAGYDNDLSRYYMPYGRFREAFRETSNYSSSIPTYWTIYNTNVLFAWEADKNYTFQHDYNKSATTLEDDADIPELPEEFQEILVIGALVRCLETNDDNDIAQYQNSKKNLLVQSMLKRFNPQQSGKVERLRNSARGI